MSANVIQPGSRRVFPSGREIEVTGLVGSGPFAGEWEYRYVESGVTGINSALDLFNTTAPAPTNPSGGAVTSTPAPSDDTTPALVALDLREAVAERALAALVEWRKAGDVQAHIVATVALRKVADEYIAEVTR